MATSLAALHERLAYAQRIGPTVRLTVGASSLATDGAGSNPVPLVAEARYAILCPETGIYWRQGGAGVSASSADRFLAAGRFAIVTTDSVDDNRIAVIDAEGLGGYAYITRLDSLDGAERGDAAALKAAFFAPKCGSTTALEAGASSARTSALVHGASYFIECPQIDGVQTGDDVWVKQGGASVAVSDSPGSNLGMYLPRGTGFTLVVDDSTNAYLAVLSATGGNGSELRITRIDSVA